MGKHQGWRVRVEATKARAMVWVPARQGYRSKTFALGTADERKRAATKWARDEAAKVRLGLVAAQVHASESSVLAADYLVALERLGRSASHLGDVKLILDKLSTVVGDLADDLAGRRIDDWLAGLTFRGARLTPRTRNKYLVVVRGLCRWAVRHGRLDVDPTVRIREVAEPDYLRPQFKIDELRTMARAIDDLYHLRFALGFYLGLRSDETAKAAWQHFDRAGRVWAVTGKGNKQRLAFVPDELVTLLNFHGMKSKGAVFDERVQRQSSTIHWWDFHYFMHRLGLPIAGRSPHSLRHSYAGMMTATGMPSQLLRAYLGHSSEQTTSGYTKLATRYVAAVTTWQRGQPELLAGWVSVRP